MRTLTQAAREARQLPLKDYLALKAEFRDLVERCGGPVRAARLTRVSYQQITKYGSPDDEFAESFPPGDVVADLEADAGPIFTRKLAELSGHLVVELPQGSVDIVDLGRVTGKAMKEVGDVFSGMGVALDDGKLTAAEGPYLLREIDEALVMLATLKLKVASVAMRSVSE